MKNRQIKIPKTRGIPNWIAKSRKCNLAFIFNPSIYLLNTLDKLILSMRSIQFRSNTTCGRVASRFAFADKSLIRERLFAVVIENFSNLNP